MNAHPRVPAWADRLYAALLRTYPESFREEYAGEMRAAFRSRWREERQTRGLPGVASLWLSVLADTLATAVRSQGEMLVRDLRYAWRSLTGRPNWSFTIPSGSVHFNCKTGFRFARRIDGCRRQCVTSPASRGSG